MGKLGKSSLLKAVRCSLVILAWGLCSNRVWAADSYEHLQVGNQTYHRVIVSSVSASSLLVRHSKGIAQIPLDQLSPELQLKYGYDPQAAAAREAALKEKSKIVLRSSMRGNQKPAVSSGSRSQSQSGFAYRSKFGMEPQLEEEGIDLRKKYIDMGLSIRSQGLRPSCAIFAIVSALEYQNGVTTNKPEKFSEEYLIWATCKSLGRYDILQALMDSGDSLGWDAGFTLREVAQALGTYGIPLRSEAPYKKGGNWQESGDLMMQLVEKAKKRASVKVVPIPGRENESVIKNIIHTLNASTPVVIGANWPNIKILGNNPTLSTQKAAGGHAVTLVGYKNKTGSLEGVTFIFRNSWGHRWGAGGYGFIRYEYLEKHLTEALVLELD